MMKYKYMRLISTYTKYVSRPATVCINEFSSIVFHFDCMDTFEIFYTCYLLRVSTCWSV